MFAGRYFGNRYFPRRYFPQGAGTIAAVAVAFRKGLSALYGRVGKRQVQGLSQ